MRALAALDITKQNKGRVGSFLLIKTTEESQTQVRAEMAREAHTVPFSNPLAHIWNENHQWQGLLKASQWKRPQGHSGTEKSWLKSD
jgi:hypothetical protein